MEETLETLTPQDTSVICPANDGESAEIVKIALQLLFDVRISKQPWGATLDREPVETFRNLCRNVVIVEIPDPVQEDALRQAHNVYIIDHHHYDGLDRYSPESSLEQFAERIGYSLSRWEMGIAINDRGHIPALRQAGYSEEEIRNIRRVDLDAQGYTKADFKRCESEYAEGRKIRTNVYLVTTKSAKASYFADLHNRNFEKKSSLLLLQINDGGNVTAVSFYGPSGYVKRLYRKQAGYCGGNAQHEMFWGKTLATPADQETVLTQIMSSIDGPTEGMVLE